MKIKISILVFLLFAISFAIAGAEPKREFRGAWVTAWSSGILSPEEADETVRLAKEANMNALFIQVRKVGDAYYKSNYEPRASNITGPTEYDPLGYVIEKAHAQGLEVHAWLNTFRVWTRDDLPEDPNHIVNQHPDWLTRTAFGETRAGEGLYLDPGVPEVQDYTFNVFMDVVNNYNIDGIHFDFVRYPGPEFGYAPTAVDRFNLAFGRTDIPSNSDPAWQQWRREQVTALVRRVYRAVIKSNPRIKITAATIPWGDCTANFCDTSPFLRTYQDWCAWMKEGILDANIPMNYKDESNSRNAREYRNWLDGFKRWQYGRHVYSGLDFNARPDYVVRQLEAARSRGVNGMVGFPFNQTEARPKLVEALKNGIYSDPALVPLMPWKSIILEKESRKRYAMAVNAALIRKDLDQAIALLRESLDLNPDYTDARFRLGQYLLRKGMREEAVKEFEKVLLVDPDHSAAREEMETALRPADGSSSQE
ncbi:MAG: family 10 glycosylhydrolase [Armatimonadetes bacterium]|nr:family 10 glycosylhydrolase [Armatimonadota bacterium]